MRWLLDPNNLTAISTGIIAIFTIVLAAVSLYQGILTRRAITLGNREFVASHRPKLVIRDAYLHMPTPTNGGVDVSLAIANAGDGWAKIIESRLDLFIVNGPLNPLVRIEDLNPVGEVEFEAGTRVDIRFPTLVFPNAAINEQGRQLNLPADRETNSNLWLRGFVVYVDRNELKRRTAICRAYDFRAGEFRASDNPNFEYID